MPNSFTRATRATSNANSSAKAKREEPQRRLEKPKFKIEVDLSALNGRVHFADEEYDHGPIILQRRVPVLPDDTVETLAARVFDEEKRALPEAIRRVLAGEARFRRD